MGGGAAVARSVASAESSRSASSSPPARRSSPFGPVEDRSWRSASSSSSACELAPSPEPLPRSAGVASGRLYSPVVADEANFSGGVRSTSEPSRSDRSSIARYPTPAEPQSYRRSSEAEGYVPPVPHARSAGMGGCFTSEPSRSASSSPPARRSTPIGPVVDRSWHSASSLSDDDEGGDSPAWPAASAMGYLKWGRDHPDGKVPANSNVRARWTDSELRYIERWCTKHKSASMKDMLECIRGDPDARNIFHARHVLKTDRLRAGHQAYLTKAGLNDK